MKIYQEEKRIIIGRSSDKDWFDLIESFVETMAKSEGVEQSMNNTTKNLGASVRRILREKQLIGKDYVIAIRKHKDGFPEKKVEIIIFNVEVSELEGKILTHVTADNGKLMLVVKDPVYIGLKQYKKEKEDNE